MVKTLHLIIAILLALPFYALAMDGTKLLQEVDRNLSPESYESYRKLINIEPDGRKKEFTLFTVKKGADKIASVFLAPASDKDRSTLRLGGQYVAQYSQCRQTHPHHQPAIGCGAGYSTTPTFFSWTMPWSMTSSKWWKKAMNT